MGGALLLTLSWELVASPSATVGLVSSLLHYPYLEHLSSCRKKRQECSDNFTC